MTVNAPELFEPKLPRRYAIHAQFIRDNHGVDPAMLAADLNIQEMTVRTIQRKLGLRGCTNQRNKE
jgi:hypothetical protein